VKFIHKYGIKTLLFACGFPWLFRDFRVKWDKGFGAGGRRGIFLLQKSVTFSFAGFLEKEDAVVGVGMMV